MTPHTPKTIHRFNYLIYKRNTPWGSTDQGDIIKSGSSHSHSLRGIKQQVSNQAPADPDLRRAEWHEGSEDEYYKETAHHVLYIHTI